MAYDRLTACRCCGSEQLLPVLDLGHQPLANCYTREPTELPVFPLQLVSCRSCFHNQLSVTVHPDLMFREYLYVSGTSRTFCAHFADLAREALSWIAPRSRRVLDLACNDGTLLEAFRSEGCQVQGIDPAGNLVELARRKGFDVLQGYWPDVQPEVETGFDIVTATNVLAHVANPRAFLEAALEVVNDSGAVIVEFPYCREMILQCHWDTIYHEHLSYFLVHPLLELLDKIGAAVTHVRKVSSHGGSLRMAIQRGPSGHCPEILDLVDKEAADGLQQEATYRRFAEQVDLNCYRLTERVQSLTRQGKTVIGYGASAKGNTLLNRCKLPLAYIVDDNPLKHGYYTPGQQIPIRPPEAICDELPGTYFLLLAWNLAAEIVEKVWQRRPGKGDHAIHYVPVVSEHPIAAAGPAGGSDPCVLVMT